MATKRKTIEELLATLKGELRSLDLKWIEKLEAQILADESVEPEYRQGVNVRKIYNVFNNIVRDNGWKMLMYEQGKKLKSTLTKKLEKIIN